MITKGLLPSNLLQEAQDPAGLTNILRQITINQALKTSGLMGEICS